MKKLKLNKKIITIATYTIAILSAIGFAIYPETNAIFKKDNEKALAYISSLDNTYTGTIKPVLNREASTLNVARITLTLPRDDRYIKEGEKYVIEAVSSTPYNTSNPETVCSIVPNTKSSNLKIDADNNITFTNTENGVIDIECNVEANKLNSENLKVLIKYYEKVLDEERFLYKEGSFSMDYNEYADPYKEPPADSIILIKNEDGSDKSSEDIYKEFLGIITKHAEASEYYTKYIKSMEIFENYINDNNITETTAKDVLIDALDFDLLGVTRSPSKNEDGTIKGYGFEFDENFIGYVKTHSFYNEIYLNRGDFIFFSSNDVSKIEEALKNSITKWSFKNNDKNYEINGENYNKASLVLKYIETYIKNKNLDYSISNLNSIPGLYNGTETTSGYPYTGFRPTVFDYAYNYLAGNVVRVSYYEDLSTAAAEAYIKTIAYSGINDMYASKNAYIATILMLDLNNKNSDFYKTVICRNTCEDYNTIYYNNGKYYKVSVIHNEKDKYNEIRITEEATFENIATELFDSNVISGIQNNLNTEGSLLNKAITCKAADCEVYSEVHYNADKGEYLLVDVAPNNTYRVNKLTINKKDSFINSIESNYGENLIESINTGLSDQLLNDAITCTGPDCEDYYEIHYDKDTTNYMIIRVSTDSTNNYNTINISVLKSVTDTTINEELIKNLNSAWIYLKETDIDIYETLIKYLDNSINGIYADMGVSPNNPLYSYGYYLVPEI
jgi:hypothetical protein